MGWYNANWQHRVKVTVNSSKVSADYADYPLMLAADNFPAGFWSNVKSDGSDIVVTSSDGTTKLPRDLLHINTTANSHVMHLRTKVTLTNATAKTLYIYYGNSSASESNDTNTWASKWKFYLPMYEDPSGTAPQEIDRTANSKDGTSTGSMTSGDLVDGPLHKALELDGSDDGISIGDTEFATAGSVVFWAKPANRPGSRGEDWFRSRHDSPLQLFDFSPTASNTMYCGWYDDGDDDRVLLNTSGYSTNTWELWTLAWSNSGSTGLWRNATLEGFTSTLTSHWNTSAIEFIFGQGTLGNGPAQITISECRYTTQKLSTPTVTLIYNNESSPSTFYSVGAEEDAPEWYNSSWPYRVKVTVNSAKVAATQTDYPLLITESNMPSHFWDNVQNDGGDIVVTKDDGNTKISRDLISINTTSNTMMLRTKIASVGSSEDTIVYLYYGNGSANESNLTNTYSSSIKAYWPLDDDPSGTIYDRTGNDADGSVTGSVTSVDGVADGKALKFDASSEYITFSNYTMPLDGTLVFFYNPASINADERRWVFSGADSGGDSIFDVLIWTDGSTYAGWTGVGDDRVVVSTANTLSVNTWQQLAVTWADGGTTTYYIDGASQGTVGGVDSIANTNTVKIARGLYDDKLDATLDEVFIFNTLLTANDLKTYGNNITSPSTFYSVSSPDTTVDMPDSDAVADTLAPTVSLGSITVTGAAISAAGGVAGPTVQYGSLSLAGLIAFAAADGIDPSIIEGSLSISGAIASAVADVFGPTIGGDDVTITGAIVSAPAGTNGPTVVLGSTSVAGVVSAAVSAVVAPTIQIAAWVSTSPADAVVVTVDPGISLATTVQPSDSNTKTSVVTPVIATSTLHWFWSNLTQGWFRDEFTTSAHNPRVVATLDGDSPNDRTVVIGGEDGYIRHFDKNKTSDDGVAISSYVIVGPIASTKEGHPVILSELQGLTANWSDVIYYEILAGDTPRDAVQSASAPMATDESIEAGKSHTDNPRVRNQYIYVKLGTNDTTSAWALELLRAKVVIVTSDPGRRLN